ncbi:hypothetical protein GCM10007919_06570 [Rhizobium indigoferae]|nr:hypothetical protein GCM10007919_06570 [Rhizobium indigoferae]
MTEWKTENRPAYSTCGRDVLQNRGDGTRHDPKAGDTLPNERLKFPANNASRRWETRETAEWQ